MTGLFASMSPANLAQIGVMNKLSTGNGIRDILLCILMPALVACLTKFSDSIKKWLLDLCKDPKSSKEYCRTISHINPQTTRGHDSTANRRVKVLQEAILLYMDSMPDLVTRFRTAEFGIIKKVKSGSGKQSRKRSDELQQYHIQTAAPENAKLQIAPGLFFKKVTSEPQSSDGNATGPQITTFYLTSPDQNGAKKINEFCGKALEYYKEVEAEKKDTSRYYYTPLLSTGSMLTDTNRDGGPAQSTIFYKRYGLSEDKSFASFFHPEKESLLQLLGHFTEKTGKFAIPGYPQKLGLLLHGPPGTGKTSLIKAIANYTQRNIISIPLSSVTTNQQLMDLVFDQECYIKGEKCNYQYDMPFENTIFVMEDVDAATDVVKARNDTKEDVVGSPLELLGGVKNDERDVDHGEKHNMQWKKSLWMDFDLQASEKLNLAGILNVLDGVVDCPGRIVVMTTNHPEKLDPALIRPGRINKTIYLGLLQLEQALSMVELYFDSLSEHDKKAFKSAFPVDKISPAALESLCAGCDSLEDVLVTFRSDY